MMKEQPAWLAAALKSLAVAAAGATAALLAKAGITLDGDAVAGLVVVYVALESAGAAFVASKVTPLTKLQRVAPDAVAKVAAKS